jgi:hypothetical protein
MGAKIGFQQKISPFRLAKQYLKYLKGLPGNGEVIKEHQRSLAMNQFFYDAPHFLIDYGVV